MFKEFAWPEFTCEFINSWQAASSSERCGLGQVMWVPRPYSHPTLWPWSHDYSKRKKGDFRLKWDRESRKAPSCLHWAPKILICNFTPSSIHDLRGVTWPWPHGQPWLKPLPNKKKYIYQSTQLYGRIAILLQFWPCGFFWRSDLLVTDVTAEVNDPKACFYKSVKIKAKMTS